MKNILLIEDSPTVSAMIQETLKQEGYEVSASEKGEEGLSLALENKPDLVILDTILPDIDGFEVCRRLRENEDLAGTKILIMTGSIDAVDAVKAREVGADEYCVKTQDLEMLIGNVKKLI